MRLDRRQEPGRVVGGGCNLLRSRPAVDLLIGNSDPFSQQEMKSRSGRMRGW